MKIIQHNLETGEIIEREMTKAEITLLENAQNAALQFDNDKAAKLSAILDRLNITPDEAKLLLS